MRWRRWKRLGLLQGLITQNVDGLHSAAGSRLVIDLHGRIGRGGLPGLRRAFRAGRVAAPAAGAEPGLLGAVPAGRAGPPDGDVALESVDGFQVASCSRCGGVLKPDVVFFGENVPRARVAAAFDLVDAAEALLVAGSSLTVMSGLRFVLRAHRNGVPVVIVNRGATRGDGMATARLDAGCSEVLGALAIAV